MSRKTESPPLSAVKLAWLEAGLKILSEAGEAGLTIENLARRLHLTKGSFYHHFHNRKNFSRELLAFWEKQQTLDIIESSARTGTSFADRNAALIRLSRMDQISGLEVAIRAWALRDPLVREYQQRVDHLRIDYLRELFGMLTGEKDNADHMALIRYCMYVGSQQVIPRVGGDTLEILYRKLHKMFERERPAGPRSGAPHKEKEE